MEILCFRRGRAAAAAPAPAGAGDDERPCMCPPLREMAYGDGEGRCGLDLPRPNLAWNSHGGAHQASPFAGRCMVKRTSDTYGGELELIVGDHMATVEEVQSIARCLHWEVRHDDSVKAGPAG